MRAISGTLNAGIAKWLVACAIVVIGISANISCGHAPPSKAAEGPQAPVLLGIGLEPLAALAIVAKEEGFFGHHGVAATVRQYSSGKLAFDAMLSGDVQVATVAETPVVFDSFKRRDFRILAVIGTSDNEIRIVARKDAGIWQHGDLKGKRIGAQEASSMHFFLHMFLIKHGLVEKDVAITYAAPDALAQLLIDGKVDACSMREPLISQVVATLGDNAVVFEEPGLFVKYYAVVATQRFLTENRETACNIIRALGDAEAFAKDHPQEATAIVARTLKIARPTLDPLWPQLDLHVRLNQSLLLALEDQARWAIGQGLVNERVMPNYLPFIDLDVMLNAKPSAVGIIR